MANGYEIVLKNETAKDKLTQPIANDETAEAKELGMKKFAAKSMIAFAHNVKPFIDQQIQFSISTVQLRTGSTEQQQKAQFAYMVAQKTFNLGYSIGVGALTGGVGGAIIGGVVSLATTGIGFANNQRKIDMKQDLEQISLGLMNVRAGGTVASISQSRRN